MFKVNKLVKPVVVSMLAMPVCHVQAADSSSSVNSEPIILAAQGSRPAVSSNAAIDALLSKARYWRQQKRMDLAASTWERVLLSSPNQEEALAGLATYQASVGNSAQASEYLAKLKRVNPKHPLIAEVSRALAPARSVAAPVVTDKPKAESARMINDPWLVLEEARELRKQGQTDAARSRIAHMTEAASNRDTNYAGALFYAEEKDWVSALILLDKIPESSRSELIGGLRSRAVVYVRSGLARKLHADGSTHDAVEMLSSAENDATGNPELVSIAAATWVEMKQPERAVALLERNKPLAPGLQLQYAGALLDANEDEKLGQLLSEIDKNGDAAAYDKGALDQIRIVYAVRRADALRIGGKRNEGNALLTPMLEKHSQNADLLLAYARMQGDEGALPEALKTVDAVLAIAPGNHEALRQGTVYAIQMGNYTQADRYLAGARSDDADKSGLYVEAAHAAEANQNQVKAKEYYAEANRLGANVGQVDIAASPDRQLFGSEARHKTYIETGYGIRYKSGTSGLSYMYEKEVPVAFHMPIEDNQSSIVFKAAQVNLDAGDAGPSLDLFGTNLPGAPLPVPYPINARGTAVSVGYQSSSLSADIGVSPQGFKFNDIVGGVRWNTDVAGSNIAVEATRRSVAESVLSYAGAVDNVTGLAWGGVVKTGVQAAAYYPFGGAWAGYASAGYYGYNGSNVANNSSTHLNATLIYEMARTEDFEATVSARLSSTSFNNNQNWFFWGHGGYYSPQSDNSINIPLHVAGHAERFAYEFNFGAGLASVREDASAVYPTDPVRQALMGAAGMRPGTVTGNKGSWKVDWTVEYEVVPQLVLGNRSHYDETVNAVNGYLQFGTMFYLRYDFDRKAGKLKFPPNPIRPYYITTQGGAGLN